MKKSRKGVSPIIAVLLMIVIAVAAAIVVYSFVMGYIGSSASPPMETQARIVVDEANITDLEAGIQAPWLLRMSETLVKHRFI